MLKLVDVVANKLAENADTAASQPNGEALRDAERLADLYSDVRPDPFVVPIERFVGLPILGEARLLR